MEKTKVYISIVITLVVVFGAFWLVGLGFRAPSTDFTFPTSDNSSDASGTEAVGLGIDGDVGEYLLDTFGLTLYTTTKDECTGGCLVIWPPYLAKSEVSEGDLGSVYRTDLAAHQYTWRDEALYYYVDDSFIGDFCGDGVGGVWDIARP